MEVNRYCTGRREMVICLTFILLSSTLTLTTADSVRLVDGGSLCAGRVEIYHEGQWGTVCDDYWDMRDATVVCRELGCMDAVHVMGTAQFVKGSGPIWLDDVDCSGSESELKECRSKGWGMHNCDHVEDIGIICSGVRLVGDSHCSGRVEMQHEKTWYTVCDAVFDQQEAEVVCRELGCGIPVEVLGAAAFGRGEGQVWTEELQCRGNESQIHFCPTSTTLNQNCSHSNDVGLVCSGSLLSEALNSGYEDVDENLPSENTGIGEKAEDYDDVITNNDLINDTGKVDTPEDYADVITAEPIPDNPVEDGAENYDDVITADQRSGILTEDYDDAVNMGTNTNIVTEKSEVYDDVIIAKQDVGGAEDYSDV